MIEPLDRILATLNSAQVGPVDAIASKMRLVAADLRSLERPDLESKAEQAIAALETANLAEFRRLRAFIQSKVGHLR